MSSSSIFLPSPALPLPADSVGLSGLATPIGSIGLAGLPETTVSVMLAISSGALLIDPSPGVAVFGDGSGSLLIAGAAEQVEARLASLAVLGAQPGSAQLTATMLDANGVALTGASTTVSIVPADGSLGQAQVAFETGTLAVANRALDGVSLALDGSLAGSPPPALVLDTATVGARTSLAVWGAANVPTIAAAGAVAWNGLAQFSADLARITLAQGATLTNDGQIVQLAGDTEVSGSGVLRNDGVLAVAGGQVGIGAEISGAGVISVAGGASLTLAGAVGAGQTIELDGALDLADPTEFHGTIADFAPGDVITVAADGVDRVSYQAQDAMGGTLTLSNGGTTVAQLHLAGSYADSDFVISQSADSPDPVVRISLAGPPALAGASTVAVGTAPISSQTLDVYRFFDARSGTQFLAQSVAERDAVMQSRPDLAYEGTGLHAESAAAASADANSVAVYRFFDTQSGTHFYTASVAERDQVLASRPDLVWEQGATLHEHATAEAGDVPVYRFFETGNGTHFYTASAAERAAIMTTRPDMMAEGIAFYAPAM